MEVIPCLQPSIQLNGISIDACMASAGNAMCRQAPTLFPSLDGSFPPLEVRRNLFPTVQTDAFVGLFGRFFVDPRKWHELARSGLTEHLLRGECAHSVAPDGGKGGALGTTPLLQKVIRYRQFSNARGRNG